MRTCWIRWLKAASALALAPACLAAPDLTALEWRWLKAITPVLEHAEMHRLPLDIQVQPQDTAGLPPLGMAFKDGRCKLVMSMRGNPDAPALVATLPAEAADAIMQAIAAHEVGHCWRHVQGMWNVLPAGFTEVNEPVLEDERHQVLLEGMRRTRREEGLADLVGLAWTRDHHVALYAQVHGWFETYRAAEPHHGSHSTGVWRTLARSPDTLRGSGSIFERALVIWKAGLAP